jgi:hypothetical protein
MHMIVTEPNEFAAEIHDRMPVFLSGGSVHAVADRGGGGGVFEACAERLLATLAGVEARQ